MNDTVPAAFLSYSHFNDEHDKGYITQFRALLEGEVRAQTGREFVIFQDRRDIRWGQQWRQRIEQTLDSVTLLIPILSPNFFASPECCREVKRFIEREKVLNRNDLILPVYYIDSTLLNDTAAAQRDPLAQLFNSRQYADWRPLRLESIESKTVRQAIIDLAKGICEAISNQSLGESFTVPRTAVMKLEDLLQQAGIPEDTVRSAFEAYLKTLGDQATWEKPDYSSKPLWECLFDYLLDPSWMKSSGQNHLLQFINRLAPYSATHSLHLRKWVRETAAALNISPPGTVKPSGLVDEKIQPYLLLALSPEGGYYTLYAWFMSDPGEYQRIYEEKLGTNLNDMPRHLNAILVRDEITATCRLGHPPILEFFLPVGLLNHGLDQWRLPGEKTPLSAQYCLVLRAGERLWYRRGHSNWGRYWNQHCDAFCEAANQHHAIWLKRPARKGYSTYLDGGQWIFGLHFVPDSDCLETLLEAGVGILLWPRQEVRRIILSIKTQMKQQVIRDLPEWLRKWRKTYWERCGETGSLALLWDDPERMPDDYQPLPPHPDF